MNNCTFNEIKSAGLDKYYVLHGKSPFYTDPNGYNWTSNYTSTKGDTIVDLTTDMASEEQARITYEYLLSLTNEQSLIDPLVFLREREIVHFQRFGEALIKVREYYTIKTNL